MVKAARAHPADLSPPMGLPVPGPSNRKADREVSLRGRALQPKVGNLKARAVQLKVGNLKARALQPKVGHLKARALQPREANHKVKAHLLKVENLKARALQPKVASQGARALLLKEVNHKVKVRLKVVNPGARAPRHLRHNPKVYKARVHKVLRKVARASPKALSPRARS